MIAWVADDDAELRWLVRITLQRAGFTVEEHPDGRALLARIATLQDPSAPRPALIVTDQHMPGAQGLDALAALEQVGVVIPVLLISAFADAALREQARQCGAAAVLGKPFELDELFLLAQELCGSEQKPR
jgi:CheY-like chemotaxis protein